MTRVRQAMIWLCFHINKEVNVENLEDKSLCAQLLVYDVVKCCKKDQHDIELTAQITASCKTACSRYVITLKGARKSRENEATNKKRKIIAVEIDGVKRKWMVVDTCSQSLNKDMNKYLDKGAASHDMAMFLKASAFRKAISE